MSTIGVKAIKYPDGDSAINITDGGNVTLAGTLGVTGETTLATHLNLGDNDRIKIGAGSDIQIYHDGSYSRIMESGGTALVLDTTSADIRLTADNSEVMGKFIKNGAVQLFYDNSQKFSTTTSGVTITGVVGISESSPAAGLHITSTNNDLSKIRLGYSTSNHFLEIGRQAGYYRLASFEDGQSLTFGTSRSAGATTERMRIDADGKVGIGTSVAPHQKLTVTGVSGPNNGPLSNGILALTTGTGAITDTRMLFGVVDDSYGWIQTGDYGVAYRFLILNPNGGNVLVGTTNQSPAEGTGVGVRIGNNGTSQFSSSGDAGLSSNRTSDNGNAVTLRRDGTLVGSISVTGSSTAFNTSSDYRLKENVNYEFDATSRIKQLKPCRFNFKTDADKTVDGFIAHEIPDGKKIGDVKEAPKIDAQGIDQSKLVPLLTKSLQEALTRIDALEAEVKELKG